MFFLMQHELGILNINTGEPYPFIDLIVTRGGPQQRMIMRNAASHAHNICNFIC